MQQNHKVSILKIIFSNIIPIILLISGIIIFTGQIPGWSLIIGLPMIVFGVVFMIYSYDELAKNGAESEITDLAKCSICKRYTNRDTDVLEEDTICPSCQTKLSRLFKHKSLKK